MRFNMALVLAAILAIFPFVANAQEKPVNDLLLMEVDIGWFRLLGEETVSFVVDDQVSDGCWTSVDATKTAVKLQFIRSGYTVIDEISDLGAIIRLQGMGYKTSTGQCISTVSVDLWIRDYGTYTRAADGIDSSITSIFFRELMTFEYLMSGGPSASSRRIKEKLVEMSQEMLVEMSAKKHELKEAVAKLPDSNGRRFWSDKLRQF